MHFIQITTSVQNDIAIVLTIIDVSALSKQQCYTY